MNEATTSTKDIDRFWTKVIKQDRPDGCWEWQAARTANGYGSFKCAGRSAAAHRWIYQTIHGPLTPDQVVRHKCDNPLCVRPDHLELGSHADNVRDRDTRGHGHRGERNGRAKLDTQMVLSIRRRAKEGERRSDLAAEFGIHRSTVGLLIRRSTWKAAA